MPNEMCHMWVYGIIAAGLLSEEGSMVPSKKPLPHNSFCNMSGHIEALTDVKVSYLIKFQLQVSINYPSQPLTETPRRLVAMALFLSERSYFPKNQRSGFTAQAHCFFELYG